MGLFREAGRRVERFKRQVEDAAAEETDRRCAECDARIDDAEDECPACGAPIDGR